MTNGRFANILITAALMAGCAFLLFNPLRLAFIANVFVPFLISSLLIMLCCGLWFCAQWRRVEIKRIEYLLVLFVVVTAAFTPYEGRKAVDIGIDLLRPILFVVTVIMIRNFVNVEMLNYSKLVRWWLRASMWVTLVIVPVCWLISVHFQPLYPAFSSIDSVLGLGWLLAVGNGFGSGLYLSVLIASGKRGVYLAAFLVLCVCFLNRRLLTRRGWGSFVLGLAVGGFIFSLLLGEIQQLFFKGVDVGSGVEVAEAGAKLTEVASGLGGGRVEELRGALSALTSYSQLIFGAGLGFAYPAQGFGPAGELHRNLHFTPASLAFYYGVPFTLAFFYYLSTFFFAALRITNRSPGVVSYCYAVYCLSSMLFLLTEFSVFSYANFAISCGVVGATTRMQDSDIKAGSQVQ